MSPRGGPERKAFGIDKVVPMNFSGEDPFWDVAPKLNQIEESCRSGEISDLVIIERRVKPTPQVRSYWRGDEPLTTVLGMLEYAKSILIEDANK